MEQYNSLHHHVLADFHGCPPEVLRDEKKIARAMRNAAKKCGATIVTTTFHTFTGGGITGVVAVKESHLTIHTWPETGYAAIDVFLCGECRPEVALEYLSRHLHPSRTKVHRHKRGGSPSPRANAPAGPEALDEQSGAGQVQMAPTSPAARNMSLLYFLTLTVAACSIIYELLLAQTLSALLGNTVLRYSITVGCYLGALGVGAMLCSHQPAHANRRLISTELGLAAIGGIAVPLFYFLDAAQRYFYYSADTVFLNTVWVPLAFLGLTHAVIIAIGLLSGFEVPLLLAMARERRTAATNRMLGVDYLGALIGSVLFPVVFLRHLGLLSTGFLVASINALACTLIVLLRPERRSAILASAGVALAGGLFVALSYSGSIEQYFLKKFYFVSDIDSLAALVNPQPDRPDIQRFRSPYQTIDIIDSPSPSQWAYQLVSSKSSEEPDAPDNWRLYLDRDFQVFSGAEEFYHEWFVHAPIQAVGHPPKNVLVLGGGDGLAIRELLEYEGVERITHVDIDPEMIRLCDEHPVLSALNGGVHDNPRVHVARDDAFHWLRATDERFDAIYIDMPYPRDYNLAQVYSREFYSLARHRLDKDGFLILDAPDGDCHFDGLWKIYYNTLRAGGFHTITPVISHIDTGKDPIAGTVEQLAEVMELTMQTDDGPITLTPEQIREWLIDRLDSLFYLNEHEFILAFPGEREINTSWRDMNVRLFAFGPDHLSDAFELDCTYDNDDERVNSIFRPTLPPLELLSVKLP